MTPDDLYTLQPGDPIRIVLRGFGELVVMGRFLELVNQRRGAALQVRIKAEFANGQFVLASQIQQWPWSEIASLELMECIS